MIQPLHRLTSLISDCEMGTENKEVIPKEEISEESQPHGAFLEKMEEKLTKVACRGREFGAVCEEDILEGHSGESTEKILGQESSEERDFASELIIFKKSPSSEKDQEKDESERVCRLSSNLLTRQGDTTVEAVSTVATSGQNFIENL